MNSLLFSLTLLISVLPLNLEYFNTFLGLTLTQNSSTPLLCECTSLALCTHSVAEPAIPFGATMGKYIKQKLSDEENYQIKTIVIDPGHGGIDSGCSGKHSKEKKIVLKLAKKIGRQIKAKYPHIRVIYTRKTDVFIPLYQRAAIANENQADLFISLHCNAIRSPRIKGSETYVMGLHTANENLQVAKRENASILLEEDYQQNYDGYDPNSPEGHIILSMYQNAHLEQSILFAEKIEQQMKHHVQRRSRGIKQAGFVVLRATAMPSVLVETGYLTNSSDERFLNSDAGQNKVANAITKAFSSYKATVETKSSKLVTKAAPAQQSSTLKSNKIRYTKTEGAAPVQFKVQLAS
ncbi:MAG: N-acetylmuramoyl-L-alanine amidase, partial [Saprospiraceae bacterium]